MADRIEHVKAALLRRPALAMGAAVAVIAAGLMLHSAYAQKPETADVQRFTVQPRELDATISLVGTVRAGTPLEISAPFDGRVMQTDFTYGDPVAAGQVLMRMDTQELNQQVRDAEARFLKAQAGADDLDHWDSSADVSRARRAVQASQLEMADTERKLAETKVLLDKGLVPRSEYDALTQQRRSQNLTAAAAQEDFAAAMRHGSGTARHVAVLELEAARAGLVALRAQLKLAAVSAPTAGVFVRPPSTSGSDGGVHIGQRLARGQLIGSIARNDSLIVEVELNEADAGHVRPGQSASVQGGGLGELRLKGEVVSVAGEAKSGGDPNGSSTVTARVRLANVPPGQTVRIGTTANVVITTYENPAALVVPPEALIGSPPLAQVQVLDPHSGLLQLRSVVVGATQPDGIEIKTGLASGEIVIVRRTGPAPPAGAGLVPIGRQATPRPEPILG